MTLIQSVADAVATAAPRLAAASPTSAAVSGAAAYALTRWMARDAGVSPSRR
ncbi:hypothetical protein [Haloglomus irregulare]|jgi:hypothetical protein|uniref:hypothetical protein n=1 Tax=Haloglomus irregulare TaxID=2234134 RepID=UPI00163DE03A|nr:hypothetical protein [Haloglomus irregulare]